MKTKKLFMIMGVAAMALMTLGACKKNNSPGPNNPPAGGTLTAPVLTSSAASAVLTEAQAAETALTLTWTAASTEEGVTVGYKIYVNLASKDIFTSPAVIDAAGALTYNLTHAELNTAMTQVGATAGSANDVKIAVYANHTNGNYSAILSNTLSVSVTPYLATVTYPDNLVMLGEATEWKWDTEDALRLAETATDGIYEATDVVLKFTDGDIGFKFYYIIEDGQGKSPYYGQKVGSAFGDVALITGDTDSQFYPGKPANGSFTSGTYTVNVNLLTMKMTLTRTGNLPTEPEKEYLIVVGNSVSWAWDDSGLEASKLNRTAVGSGIYKATMAFNFNESDPANPCGFKIYKAPKRWADYYGQATTPNNTATTIDMVDVEGGDAQFYPGKLGFTSGTYDVTADLNTMKLTLERQADPEYPATAYIMGPKIVPYWQMTAMTTLSDGVYEITVAIEELSTGGFKFFDRNDWNGWKEFVQDPAGDFGDVRVRPDNENPDDDTLFKPDMPDGTYKVTLDLTQMKVTMTPAS